jgi:hypothetical protein
MPTCAGRNWIDDIASEQNEIDVFDQGGLEDSVSRMPRASTKGELK